VTKKHCASCGLPIRFIQVNDGWAWVHDATLTEILRRSVTLGVPARHSLTRMTSTFTKEASIGKDRNEDDNAA
jgi:hypothetical protein